MKYPLVKGLSQRVVAYNPILTRITGRLSAGILLSQIMYWSNVKGGGLFYKTDKEFADELGIGLDELKSAKKLLVTQGYISVVKRGVPQRSNYLLMVEFTETKIGEYLQLVGGDATNCSVEMPPTNSESTTEITTESIDVADAPSPLDEKKLPEIMGKTPIARIAFVYSLMYRNRYQEEYRVSNWAALTKTFAPLFKDFSEWQVAALITLHFDWHGASGSDEFIHRKLAEKRFPLEWVPRTINEYRPYFRENLGFPFDDQETIKRHVTSIIKPLYKQQTA